MNRLNRSRKPISIFLIIVLLLPLISSNQVQSKDTLRVENVRFKPSDGKIFINYDLIGPQDKQYIITLTLRREQNPSMQVQPKLLKGDIGKGHFAGRRRQIVWDFSREVPRALKATDYYFVVEAEFAASRSKSLFWITAGTILTAGGSAIYLFVFKKNGDAGFPEPPGTPK